MFRQVTITLALTSAVLFLLIACSASNTIAPSEPAPQAKIPHHRHTAAELGLWPRPGRAKPVCPGVRPGSISCESLIRTDIQAQPNTSLPLGYAPSDLWSAYAINPTTLPGQTIAIVVKGDSPTVAQDLNYYRSFWGLPPCTSATACFTKISSCQGSSCVAGDWPLEIAVDTQMVSAMCPFCKIVLVEAPPTGMTADMAAAEVTATQRARFVSNSWDNLIPGETGDVQQYDHDFNVPGVLIAFASGDSGYEKDGTNIPVFWPQILPSVVSVGGTSLQTISPRFEKAWTLAGSACSTIYLQPSFQRRLNTGCISLTPMRTTADVSAVADPNTGVAIYYSYNNNKPWKVLGGTSISTPIITAIFALANDTSGNTHLYQNSRYLYDVTTGNNGGGYNGDCGTPLCDAGSGWDGPTGLGTPNGLGAF